MVWNSDSINSITYYVNKKQKKVNFSTENIHMLNPMESLPPMYQFHPITENVVTPDEPQARNMPSDVSLRVEASFLKAYNGKVSNRVFYRLDNEVDDGMLLDITTRCLSTLKDKNEIPVLFEALNQKIKSLGNIKTGKTM